MTIGPLNFEEPPQPTIPEQSSSVVPHAVIETVLDEPDPTLQTVLSQLAEDMAD